MRGTSAIAPSRDADPSVKDTSARSSAAVSVGDGRARTEQNKAVIGRFIAECMNSRRIELLKAFVAADVVIHPSTPAAIVDGRGLDDFKSVIEVVHQVFSDLHVTVEDVIAEDDRVVVRWTVCATHTSDWHEIPATGRRVKVGGIDIYRLERGKIRDWWRNDDLYSLLEQLRSPEPSY